MKPLKIKRFPVIMQIIYLYCNSNIYCNYMTRLSGLLGHLWVVCVCEASKRWPQRSKKCKYSIFTAVLKARGKLCFINLSFFTFWSESLKHFDINLVCHTYRTLRYIMTPCAWPYNIPMQQNPEDDETSHTIGHCLNYFPRLGLNTSQWVCHNNQKPIYSLRIILWK